jgi:hypothetical protein
MSVAQLVDYLTQNPVVKRLDRGRLLFLKHQQGGMWFRSGDADLFVPLRDVVYTASGFRVANIAYTYICEESDNVPESIVGRIVDYEMGLLSEVQTVSLFQEIFDSGLVWCLQPAYNAEIKRLLEAGLVKDTTAPPEPVTDPLVLSLIEKLGPGRLLVSAKFHAILAYMLGRQSWVEPPVKSMYLTSNDILVVNGSVEGDRADLIRNIEGVCDAVKATPKERAYMLTQVSVLSTY